MHDDCESVDNVVEPPVGPYVVLWKEDLEKAEQGDADAQLRLAFAYWAGAQSDSRDDVASSDWKREAYWRCRTAVQGDAEAQFVLAELFEDGHGVGQDFAEAYFWFSVGFAAPDTVSREDVEILRKERDEAAAHLSYARLAQVRGRVRKWLEEGHTPKLFHSKQ
jgi:hypothetical protein